MIWDFWHCFTMMEVTEICVCDAYNIKVAFFCFSSNELLGINHRPCEKLLLLDYFVLEVKKTTTIRCYFSPLNVFQLMETHIADTPGYSALLRGCRSLVGLALYTWWRKEKCVISTVSQTDMSDECHLQLHNSWKLNLVKWFIPLIDRITK